MKYIRILTCLAALGSTTAAFAGTASTTLPVSAIVLENCTVVASPLAFGALTDVGAADVDSSALLTLACTPNADFYIAMDNGLNAVSGARRMKSATAAEFLPYEIYTNTARTQRWGSTSGTDTVAGTAPLGVATFTAYGRIPQGVSAVSAGSFSDTVTVTINF